MEKLKKIGEMIWTFLNSRLFVIGLIVLLFMFLVGQCKRIIDKSQEVNQHEQNISALTDSLKYERQKNGDLVISIDGYIATERDLRNLNKNLAREIAEQKGKVISLNTVVIHLRQDSVMLAKALDEAHKIIGAFKQIDKDTYETTWELPYRYDSLNYDTFKGTTLVTVLSKDPLTLRHKDTYMTSRSSSIYLAWGQKMEKGKLRVFVESPYPGLSVANMQGVLIDPSKWPDLIKPEKRHWFTGFGVGPNISAGWNVLEAKPAVIVGVGFHYNIYEW